MNFESAHRAARIAVLLSALDLPSFRSAEGGDPLPAVAAGREPDGDSPDSTSLRDASFSPKGRNFRDEIRDMTTHTPATISDQQSTSKSPLENIWGLALGAVGAVAAAGSMSWYYMSVRARSTSTSLSSSVLFFSNSLVLFGTACLIPHQGYTTILTYGIYVLGGAAIAQQVIANQRLAGGREQSEARIFPRFDTTEKLCALGCAAGLFGIAASNLAVAETLVGKDNIIFISSALAAAVNSIASIPLFRENLKAPSPGSQDDYRPDTSKGKCMAILGPMLPWLISTVAFGACLLSIPEYSWATLLSPTVLFANDLAMAFCTGLWAWRRVR